MKKLIAPLALFLPLAVQAAERVEFIDLSLEQLSAIRVTSVSLHEERVVDAPASIFVITGDAIRRSGASTLPEALRLAPNLLVARTGANAYSISARGINNAGNKMLVLIDGRVIYTPLYSGVIWDAQDVMLEDVERIEVISGPGGALWGSNAVNGVINIITRSAQDNKADLVHVSGGNWEKNAAVRAIGSLGATGRYRIYAKSFQQANSQTAGGNSLQDDLNRVQAGFRGDWGAAEQGFTLQGDAYQGRSGQVSPAAYQHIAGYNVLGRWTRPAGANGRLQLQAYYDQTERKAPGTLGYFFERLKIVDLSLQHHIGGIEGHALVWGGGYRGARDALVNYPTLAYLPGQRDMSWANAFVQDEIELPRDMSFTAGIKVERNPYTGVEFLPSLRLDWKPGRDQIVWGALSRAVRTPARLDRDLYAPAIPLPAPLPPFIIAGGPDFRSEVSNVAEIGYRSQPTPAFSYSLTAYHQRYDRLRSVEAINDPAFVTAYFVVGNKMEGHATGLEGWGTLQVAKDWRITAGAYFLDQHLRMKADSTDPTGVSAAGNDPRFQWMLRSSHDLASNVELDIAVRRVGALPNPAVPAYTAVDARIGWRARPDMEISLAVQNLFDPGHIEYGDPAAASEVKRSVLLRVVWRP